MMMTISLLMRSDCHVSTPEAFFVNYISRPPPFVMIARRCCLFKWQKADDSLGHLNGMESRTALSIKPGLTTEIGTIFSLPVHILVFRLLIPAPWCRISVQQKKHENRGALCWAMHVCRCCYWEKAKKGLFRRRRNSKKSPASFVLLCSRIPCRGLSFKIA